MNVAGPGRDRLRASVYYARALSTVDGTKDPAALLEPTFRAHRRCFDAYVALLDLPGEKVEIPYEGDNLPRLLLRSRCDRWATPHARSGRWERLPADGGSGMASPVPRRWVRSAVTLRKVDEEI
jgi:hypothetical protein